MACAPISTLKFCSELDPVALKFHHFLQPFHDDMSAHVPNAVANTASQAIVLHEPSSYDARYLCDMPQEDLRLNERARTLREMLCRPFGASRQKVNHLKLSQRDWHIGPSISFHWNQNFRGVEGEKCNIHKH
jgi:hypothetical protein